MLHFIQVVTITEIHFLMNWSIRKKGRGLKSIESENLTPIRKRKKMPTFIFFSVALAGRKISSASKETISQTF